ncbi:MAG: site-2 protease family protein [Candidatus Desantisbacteria bacterium]
MNLFIYFAVLIFSVTVHEVAHGWMADKCGDSTARLYKRLTLNPLAHLDLVGSILIPLLLFLTRSPIMLGWAKPVPVNFYNLRNPKADMVKVALAGPGANIGLALISSLILRLGAVPQLTLLEHLLLCGVIVNFILAIFNLLPIPPLDGSKILMGILPSGLSNKYARLERFGFFILILFIAVGALDFVVHLAFYLSYFGVGERHFHLQ